jgi:hypothetical protein
MNSLQYIFSVIHNIKYETALAEACDWDYERAEDVKKILSECFHGIHEKSNPGQFASINDAISFALSDKLTDSEISAVLEISSEISNDIIIKGGLESYDN